MPSFDSVYGSRWLKAVDLDKPQKLQIEAAEWQKVGKEKEDKIVLAFSNHAKCLILNVTNGRALADAWGKAEALWPGRWLEAAAVETTFGPGVKIKPIQPPVEPAGIPF